MGLIRHIETHRTPGDKLNEVLRIGVIDEPNAGGASHKYVVYIPNDEFNEELNPAMAQHITFQQGNPALGINGISKIALLAIVKDQLASLQTGPFACEENVVALSYISTAMNILKQRTTKRVKRGVCGQETK